MSAGEFQGPTYFNLVVLDGQDDDLCHQIALLRSLASTT
eukprot:CAMPEP_0175985614 /NCGR_PEP_ID=MMETSP0108-20121206/49674_1 /TAXON_ID=195067 ORGANISM="Goniomonas pacifica, Strain CCMP1869" /NCGR_SAMPLE_ID=MMETSP0108 /ASSEMBLY_ACC=CAM_ASM_000204 /LENGTH=38 /DNA_ID= /DNA_START= /DNA_END= /DNA_ORIENTATION=